MMINAGSRGVGIRDFAEVGSREPPPDNQEVGARGGGAGIDDPPILLAAPINDYGHACCFEALFGHEMRHHPDVGWCLFNGTSWEEGCEHEARLRAGQVIERRLAALDRQEVAPGEEGSFARRRRELERSGSRRRLDEMLHLAADRLHVDPRQVMSPPYLLGAPNGVVDLRDGALHPHDRTWWIIQASGVDYAPDARSGLWEKAVLEIADGDPALAAFLQRIAGYACTGEVDAQRFFYFLGDGANGKSLLTDLWTTALGGFDPTGYAVRLPVETVTGRRERLAGAPSPELLSLRGKRLALCSEPDGERPVNSGRLKDLTGGDAITGRAPHGKPVTFAPTHTLIGCGNHPLEVHASDHGLWRRLMVVPFRQRFEPSNLRAELGTPESLRAILAWMVRGAVSYYREGLGPIPAAVEAATRQCRSDEDRVQAWIDEACVRDAGAKTETKALFSAFDAWCIGGHELRISHSCFTRRLVGLGFERRKSNGRPLMCGIRLKRCPEPESTAVF